MTPAINAYALQPILDRRKSFYNKASVFRIGNTIMLRSYETYVCRIEADGKITLTGLYSQTTTRHRKDFLYQHRDRYADRPEYAKLITSNFATAELKKLI